MSRGEHSESFRTYTGRYVWPLDPRPEDVDLVDVAHALARINRFNGHTAQPYSVAEHAVRVSHLVESIALGQYGPLPHALDCTQQADMPGWCSCGSNLALKGAKGVRLLALWALHHDDSEFLLVDFPRPMKHTGALGLAYREAEARLMACVCQHFSLPITQPYLVEVADKAMLLVEQRDLMNGRIDGIARYGEIAYSLPTMQLWDYAQAEQGFLQRHYDLTGGTLACGGLAPLAKGQANGR